jgi:hypothetical protein
MHRTKLKLTSIPLASFLEAAIHRKHITMMIET